MSITALAIITAATDQPITLAEAKNHLRITHNFENDNVGRLLGAVTAWAQDETRRILMNTVVEHKMHGFPSGKLILPGGKVSAVESVTYTDVDNATQVLSGPTSTAPGTDFQEDLSNDECAFLYPSAESFWPDVKRDTVNAVVIRYTVGFGADSEDVPESIRQAMYFQLADMYTIRDSEAAAKTKSGPTVADNLIHPYRLLAV